MDKPDTIFERNIVTFAIKMRYRAPSVKTDVYLPWKELWVWPRAK